MRQNKYFLLALLSLVGVLNFVDRQILAILLESIKEDLDLSDRQLGLLSGFYFALFYAFFGIPIALLADRWHRGKIISISLLVWSSMTFISGYATSFLHLIAARIGVGLGEAGVAPASHSLITEHFEPRQRPFAFAIYAVGGTLGILIALGGGGWINQNYGWRTAFFVAGVPGVVFALFTWFLLHEPRKVEPLKTTSFRARSDQIGITQGFALLWRMKAWRHAAIATGVTHIGTFGIGQFAPALLSRSFGLESGQVGLVLSLVIGLGGSIGALSGGILAGRLSTNLGVSWLAWTLAITFTLAGILAPFALMQQQLPFFIAFLAPYFVLSLASSGVQFAIAQSMVTHEMRATSSALLILIINLFGLGLGPLIVGQVSDMLKPSMGSESLRYAMMCMAPFLIWGAFHYYIAGRHLPKDAINETDTVKVGH